MPERGESRCRVAGEEVEHDRRVGEVADERPVGRGESPHDRSEPRGLGHAHGVGERRHRVDRQSERVTPCHGVPRNCSACSISRIDVASHSSLVAPQQIMPWPPSTAPTASGCVSREVAEREPELETGALPGEPPHLVAEALGDEPLAVGGRRERDHRVGMEVVDVVDVDERVQRRVDRRHRATVAEPARGVRRHDVVLVRTRSVQPLERADPVEHEQGEPGLGERAEVAARALHREHPGRAIR